MAVGLVLGVPAVLLLVLLVEVLVVRSREFPTDIAYEVEETVGPTDGGRPLQLRVLGNSTAAGVGAPTEAGSLPVQLAQRVATALDRAVHVTGYGVSGARTRDVRAAQLPLVTDLRTDVLVIVVGANDVTHLTPPWAMEGRTERMLRAAEQVGAPVVLGGIPRFTSATALPEPLRTTVDLAARPLRAAQRRAARDADVTFVDIAAEASPRFQGRSRGDE